MLLLLMPLIPHFANECWEQFKKDFYWPEYDPTLLIEKECTIIVQINGKKRGLFKMPMDSEEKLIIENAKKLDNVKKNISNLKIIKNIYIKNRLVNFIVK